MMSKFYEATNLTKGLLLKTKEGLAYQSGSEREPLPVPVLSGAPLSSAPQTPGPPPTSIRKSSMFSQKTVWALVYLLVAVSEGGATLNVTGKMDNLLMDFVLDELRNYLLVNKDTIIAIPPISSDFEYDLVGIPVTGWFNTSKGSFTNPATIRRIGNVTTTHSRGKVVTSMMVGFSQLKVSFPEYLATVAGISESGYIDVMIQKNGVFIEVMVLFIPHCIVSISKFELRRMGGIIVDMNGLGLLSSLEGQIVAWILQSYRTSFTRVVENAVKNKLQDLMAKTKICKFKKPY